MNIIVETLKTVNRRGFIDLYELPNTDKRVRRLRRIERETKRIYNIDTRVIYIDSKYKKLLIKDSVRGYYNTKNNYAVIFVTEDYKQNVKTLCHELTHAYQSMYMSEAYTKSMEELKQGKTTYKKAWHEVHARTEASAMCNYFLGEVAI